MLPFYHYSSLPTTTLHGSRFAAVCSLLAVLAVGVSSHRRSVRIPKRVSRARRERMLQHLHTGAFGFYPGLTHAFYECLWSPPSSSPADLLCRVLSCHRRPTWGRLINKFTLGILAPVESALVVSGSGRPDAEGLGRLVAAHYIHLLSTGSFGGPCKLFSHLNGAKGKSRYFCVWNHSNSMVCKIFSRAWTDGDSDFGRKGFLTLPVVVIFPPLGFLPPPSPLLDIRSTCLARCPRQSSGSPSHS